MQLVNEDTPVGLAPQHAYLPLAARFERIAVPITDNQYEKGFGEFIMQDHIRIALPGGDEAVLPVTEEHKRLYASQWAAYNAQQEQQVPGISLNDWAALSNSMRNKLYTINIFTVEQLAGAADITLQDIGMGARALRAQAQEFLKLRVDASNDEALKERDAEIAELKAQQQQQQEIIEQLISKVEIPKQESKPKKEIKNNG